MRKRLKGLSFAERIYVVCVITLALPMLVMSILFIFQANSVIHQNQREAQQDLVRAVADNIAEKALMMEECSWYINNIPMVYEYLRRDFYFNAPQVLELINQVYPTVDMVQAMHSDIVHSITIYSANSTQPEIGQIFQQIREISDPEILAFLESEHTTAWLFYRSDPNRRFASLGVKFDQPVHLHLRKIFARSGHLLGVTAISAYEEQLFASLGTPQGGLMELLSSGDAPEREGYVQQAIPRLGMTVRMPVNVSEIRNHIVSNIIGIIAAMTLGLALMMYIVRTILRNAFKRLNQTVAAMERVAQGQFNARIHDERDDEISRIIHQFNRVLALLEDTVARLLEKEGQQRDAQLVALQYQINPHFIYNSMYLLQLSMERAGLFDVANAVSWFADILHYNIGGTMFATFSQEIEHIRTYLKFINTFRGNPIALEENIQTQLRDRQFLRFVFQPLVENAIKYGGATTSRIIISVDHRGDQYTVDVLNDGELISGEVVERTNAALRSVPPGSGRDRRVGLHNISRRLNLFYQTRAGIYLTNHEKTGVHIYFPDDEVTFNGNTFDDC